LLISRKCHRSPTPSCWFRRNACRRCSMLEITGLSPLPPRLGRTGFDLASRASMPLAPYHPGPDRTYAASLQQCCLFPSSIYNTFCNSQPDAKIAKVSDTSAAFAKSPAVAPRPTFAQRKNTMHACHPRCSPASPRFPAAEMTTPQAEPRHSSSHRLRHTPPATLRPRGSHRHPGRGNLWKASLLRACHPASARTLPVTS
jgi:hypothetical protein